MLSRAGVRGKLARRGKSVYNIAFRQSNDNAGQTRKGSRATGVRACAAAGRGRGVRGAVAEFESSEVRAMKRAELLERVRAGHATLLKALDGLSEEEATRVGLNSQWSVRDALSHITAWELEGARIIGEIQAGTWQPKRLNKEQIDEFNARAVEDRRGRSMRESRAEFDAAHASMERVLASLPEEVDESTPAYKYAENVTFHHHESHAAQIEEWRKKLSS